MSQSAGKSTGDAKPSGYSLMKILTSPIQVIFLVAAIFTVGMLVPFTLAGYRFTVKAQEKMPEGYDWPTVSDMQLTAISAVIFAVVELSLRPLLKILFEPYCKEQKDLKMKELRSQKAANCMFKMFYFIFAVAFGYKALMNQPYLPPILGGSGAFLDSMNGYPYESHPPLLGEYLLITMGYHLGGFITHFFHERKNDFVEMALHHIVAIYLFGGCYLCNVWACGSVIAFLHDIADITTNLVKMLAESKFGNATAVSFVSHMFIWFYTRNLILPWMIYCLLFVFDSVNFFDEPIVRPFFCYLLGCMFMLHCYWFSMFVRMLNKFMNSGSTEDTQNKTQKKVD